MTKKGNLRAALYKKAWVHMSLLEKTVLIDTAAEAIARFCYAAGNAHPGLQASADNIIYMHVDRLLEISRLALEALSESSGQTGG